jgi:hypothetical protein
MMTPTPTSNQKEDFYEVVQMIGSLFQVSFLSLALPRKAHVTKYSGSLVVSGDAESHHAFASPTRTIAWHGLFKCEKYVAPLITSGHIGKWLEQTKQPLNPIFARLGVVAVGYTWFYLFFFSFFFFFSLGGDKLEINLRLSCENRPGKLNCIWSGEA